MTTLVRVALACSMLAVGCGSGSSSSDIDASPTCANMGSATYAGTEDVTITSGTCSSYPGLSVTFTITQSAGSCSFELLNSRVDGITFAGQIADHHVTWTHDPYAYGGGTLTLDSTDATLSEDLSALAGNFHWTLVRTPSNCVGVTTFDLARQ
ncbi:MAG TPA: hypothetical protein VHE35_28570 [Kofleriaceae bacterium]|nr:hypothetical protein [Kofleriaceae bacterium]